jgi:hypothetical protein
MDTHLAPKSIFVDEIFRNTTINYNQIKPSCQQLFMDICEEDQNNVIILKGLELKNIIAI